MLQTTKAITLTGKSVIDNQVVANFTANVYNDDAGNDTFNTFISNHELYDANKSAVRKDSRDFQDLMYNAQDEVADANSTDNTSNTSDAEDKK